MLAWASAPFQPAIRRAAPSCRRKCRFGCAASVNRVPFATRSLRKICTSIQYCKLNIVVTRFTPPRTGPKSHAVRRSSRPMHACRARETTHVGHCSVVRRGRCLPCRDALSLVVERTYVRAGAGGRRRVPAGLPSDPSQGSTRTRRAPRRPRPLLLSATGFLAGRRKFIDKLESPTAIDDVGVCRHGAPLQPPR